MLLALGLFSFLAFAQHHIFLQFKASGARRYHEVHPVGELYTSKSYLGNGEGLQGRKRPVKYFPPPQMKLFGHRGASDRFPENTMSSFRGALADGADGVECDLQLLADGSIVVLHDDTLRRTAGGTPTIAANAAHEGVLDAPVMELTWEQVREVDIGTFKGGAAQTLLQVSLPHPPTVFPSHLIFRPSPSQRTRPDHTYVPGKSGCGDSCGPPAAAAAAAFRSSRLSSRSSRTQAPVPPRSWSSRAAIRQWFRRLSPSPR